MMEVNATQTQTEPYYMQQAQEEPAMTKHQIPS